MRMCVGTVLAAVASADELTFEGTCDIILPDLVKKD